MDTNAFNLIAKPNYKMRPLARIKWWFRKRKYIKERAEKGGAVTILGTLTPIWQW